MMTVVACAPDEVSDDIFVQTSPLVAQSSYVSDIVLEALEAYPEMRGRTWDVSHDNRLLDDWLIQTPVTPIWGESASSLLLAKCTQDCDPDFGRQRCETQRDCTGGGVCTELRATVTTEGEAPRKLCSGHSDSLVDQIYDLMVRGEQVVDVSSLSPPDGAFEAAMRNALTLLSKRAEPPRVRLLFASFPHPMATNTTTVARSLTRDIDRRSSIEVSVGAFRSSDAPLSWNHSKIIAIDGREAIVGGHNLWDGHYLQIDPVHDLSMRVHGGAAADAQRFINEMWRYTCEKMTWSTWLTWSVWSNQFRKGRIVTGCPKPFDLQVPRGPDTGTIISVGRLGSGIAQDANQADAALIALIRSARQTLRLSQQDIGPVKLPVVGIPIAGWPDEVLEALAEALYRDVEVLVVLSNPRASAGGLSPLEAQYANGWTLRDVADRIRRKMEGAPAALPSDAIRQLLCERLHLAYLRYGESESWPSGVGLAHHDKTIAVDEQGFYIGSQNLYPAGLQEFGYIVDDSRATGTYLDVYWSEIWRHSQTTRISGAGAVCTL
jgi:phosphatidylserine/phosphatidylglycerophosphate/cardiolipin synthase-like enzyme